MRRCSFSLLFIMLLALPGIAAGRSDFIFGVATHLGISRDDPHDVLREISSSGFNSARDDVLWRRVQLRPGRFRDDEYVRNLITLIKQNDARGGATVLVLGYGNSIIGFPGFPLSDASIEAYADYVRWVVRRFSGLNVMFEIWNEWSGGMGSGTKPKTKGTPESYIRLLRASYKAAKEENGSAIILGGSVAGTDSRWFMSFVDQGGAAYLDGFSVHPYVHFHGVKGTASKAIEWLDRMHGYLKLRGIQKKIFVTEVGWPNGSARRSYSVQVAAEELYRFTVLARARDWIGGVWWYELLDGGSNTDRIEDNFGLSERNGKRKVAWHYAQRLHYYLDEFDTWTAVSMGDGLVATELSDVDRDAVCYLVWATAERPGYVDFRGTDVRSGYGYKSFILPAEGSFRLKVGSDGIAVCSDAGDLEIRAQ